MDPVGLNIVLGKLAVLMVVIERAVAQVKALYRTDLFGADGPARPWPLISLVLAFVAVIHWKLYVISAVIGHEATGGSPVLGAWFDIAISSLTASGGAAGIIDMVKGIREVRQKAAPTA